MLTPLKTRKRSPIWKYFEISYADPKLAVCLICDVRISRGGQGKSATTTSLINHLKMKHPHEHTTLITKSPTSRTSGDSSASSPASTSGLEETTERRSLWDVTDANSKNYHYLIGEMIAMDNESLSFVKRGGFKRLMETLLPHYKMPSPSYMADNVIPEIYNRIHAKIRGSISQAQAISVTSDMWNSQHKNESFLSFTAHWLSPNCMPEHGVLAIKTYTGPYTLDNVATELSIITKRWNIPHNKIHLLNHGSEGHILTNVRVTQYNTVKCFIQSLQNIVQNSLQTQVKVLDMITAARRIVSHFNHSVLAQQKLKYIRGDLHLPDHQLVQDVSTRWNSTYYLMERLLEQKQALSLYATNEGSLSNLTPSQWELMEQCLKLLKPFEEITKITSSSLSCISEVIPYVVMLQKYLEKEDTPLRTPDLLKMKSFLKVELGKQFDFNENENYMVATLLDPRFKSKFFGTIQTEKTRQKILLESLKMIYNDELSSKSNQSNNDLFARGKKIKTNTENDTTFEDIHKSFWNCYDEIATANIQNNEIMEKKAIANEIEFYLKSERADHWVNPYDWWSEKAKLYPNLMKVYCNVYDCYGNLLRELLLVQYDSDMGFILSLQEVVQKSMNGHKELMKTLTAARSIVTHFNQSDAAQQKLTSICRDLHLSGVHQLVQDVTTNWSSTYYLVQHLLEQKRAVSLYIRCHGSLVKNLSPSQWELMEQCIELLKPFEEIHNLTSSGHFRLSEVIPHVVILRKHLENEQTADRIPDLLTMRSSLKIELEEQFDFDVNDEILVATLFDPRFKSSFLDTVQTERARQKILLQAFKISCDELNTESDSDYSPLSKRRNTNENNDATIEEIQESIWNSFNNVTTSPANMKTDGMEKSEIANEIDSYLLTACLDRKANPYKWWSSNSNQYPNLLKFVQIYLSSPSSTVYNKRLFSEAGLDYEGERNNLLQNSNEEKLIFIHNNLPLIDFKY